MSHIKIWGWKKKPRTMLRYIKAGDIFSFQYNEQQYCFGRIISEITTGHVVEIFNYISEYPIINEYDIEKSSRLIDVFIIDSYGLFDRKYKGDWRIIGHQENYIPSNVENVYFTYGIDKWCKKIDIYGNETSIPKEEQSKYIKISPKGDESVKKMVQAKIGNA